MTLESKMTLQAESAVEKKEWLAAILSATHDLIEMKAFDREYATSPLSLSLSQANATVLTPTR